MKPRYVAVICAVFACVFIGSVLAWCWPVTGLGAVAIAKRQPIDQLGTQSYGELIGRYEAATAIVGTWHAKRVNGDQWSWEVTYTHPGIGSLWFGVGHLSAMMNGNSIGQKATMLAAAREVPR
jgi:hypothetical protein